MYTTKIHIGSRKHVAPQEIMLLRADLNYTVVCLLDGSEILVSTTMGKIMNRLPKESFLRINRQEVINRSVVSNYFIHQKYDEVKLQDASFIKVSRRRRSETREILNLK